MNAVGLVAFLALALGLSILLAAAYTALMLTRPPRRTVAFAVSRSLPTDPGETVRADGRARKFETWAFTSRGRRLPVWDIVGDDVTGPTVIFTHGWGESRWMALPRLAGLAPAASRVILWDLPGHGEAPGGFSLGADEATDLAALVGCVSAPGGGVVLAGSSLGAGVSIVAAAELGPGAVRGVIAEAPYRVPIVPARNVIRLAGLPHAFSLPLAMGWAGMRFGHGGSWMSARTARRFDRAGWAASLACPLLVVHGDLDGVCPVEDGAAIAAAAVRGRIEVIEGAGHLDLWTDPRFAEHVAGVVEGFVRAVGGRGVQTVK